MAAKRIRDPCGLRRQGRVAEEAGEGGVVELLFSWSLGLLGFR